MRVREDAIPKRGLGFQAQAAHDFEVGIEVVQHLAIHQGIVVIAEERLADGLDEHAYVGVVVAGPQSVGTYAIGEQVYVRPHPGHGFAQ